MLGCAGRWALMVWQQALEAPFFVWLLACHRERPVGHPPVRWEYAPKF